MDKRLSIDVGGSAIKYALMGEQHKILEQGKVPAPREVREEFVEAVGAKEPIDGFEAFRLYDSGDERAAAAIEEYARVAAVQLYNLQCVLDTSHVAIGGGISARTDLIDLIRTKLQAIFDAEEAYGIPPQMPTLVPCAFCNDANLIGAWHVNRIR